MILDLRLVLLLLLTMYDFFHAFLKGFVNHIKNEKLIREGYAEVVYIPPSEFDSRESEA